MDEITQFTHTPLKNHEYINIDKTEFDKSSKGQKVILNAYGESVEYEPMSNLMMRSLRLDDEEFRRGIANIRIVHSYTNTNLYIENKTSATTISKNDFNAKYGIPEDVYKVYSSFDYEPKTHKKINDFFIKSKKESISVSFIKKCSESEHKAYSNILKHKKLTANSINHIDDEIDN